MHHAKYCHRAGFSLMEIMAVLVVLAITSAIVLPYFGKHDDLKVASALRGLVADLAYAQSRAIAQGRYVYVRFDPARGRYALLDSADPRKVIAHPASGEPYEVDPGAGALQGVSIRSAAFNGRTTLAFDATGMPYASDDSGAPPSALEAGAIVIGCGDVTRTIVIQPVTGEIKVRE